MAVSPQGGGGGGEESVHGVAFTIYSFSTEVKVMGGLHI